MKRTLFALLVTAAALTGVSVEPVLSEEPSGPRPPKGFAAVFNGRDLTGWAADPKYWQVRDGCLVGTADGKLDYNRFAIWRGGTVKNFELRVKVNVSPGGNSGL